ncbi:MAG: hypothetical protein IKF05_09240, partial [Erysipelotrichaceae bacterium]|nr:hypothetical protein [Erysipelotrichaceae bacterium]
MTIVESLTEYFKTYPDLETKTIFVNFLKENGQSFSIEPTAVRPVMQHFIDGTYEKQFAFSLVGRFDYSQELVMNIRNSEFFEELEEWVISNNENDVLPDLDGYNAISLEITSNGYLLGVSTDRKTGMNEIRFILTYDTGE